ncbi:hemicentin-1-like isoform X2 [Poeciliopsis prolifica]|uniref:hemicentin-1-like isoform X2 n=1 Tax=Poeciliopsis prolifica TaxID=188132 RepID=UPI00241387F8|nr:hemicentin-1-like isoform X2 [Poeciliopsis prolifica]
MRNSSGLDHSKQLLPPLARLTGIHRLLLLRHLLHGISLAGRHINPPSPSSSSLSSSSALAGPAKVSPHRSTGCRSLPAFSPVPRPGSASSTASARFISTSHRISHATPASGFRAVKPSCDARQNGAQCFGALGGAVDIQLMVNMLAIPIIHWKMNSSIIFIWRYGRMVRIKDNVIPVFPSNGTVRINDLRRNDNGEYQLEMFDGNGKITGKKTLHLSVIAPVFPVQLVPQCLSQGQMKVSCVTQGDSPLYSWTLDGHKLTDSKIFSGNTEANIIILRHNILGHLVCSVRNEISNSSEGMNLTHCVVKPSCDGRKNGAQCIGALGGVIDIQLMDNMLEMPHFEWTNNNFVILHWRFNSVVSKRRNMIPIFPSNGTVRLYDLRRTDSGEYKLEIFDGKGKKTGWRMLKLSVIAPVNPVQLVPQCLSQGQMKVSCVSQGDSPLYSWTLDGRPLTNSELFSGNTEANIIVLRPNILGHLVCSVSNQASNSSEWMNVTYCAVKTSCDGRKNGARCFGVLGEAIDIQLMDDLSAAVSLNWIMNRVVILNCILNRVVTKKNNIIPVFPNDGIVRINDLTRDDSGEYILYVHNEEDRLERKTLQLSVIAPVYPVQLISQCLSEGHMKVSCVSQGDSTLYSWTLDGHALTNSEIFSRNNEANIIVLRQNISGYLVCSVSNKVSNSSKGMNLTHCVVKTSCDGRKSAAQCFGALGGTIDIHLMDNVNGTVRINDLTRNDSGEYYLEMFDRGGEKTGWKTLHLSVLAPVYPVQLVPQCLSKGQMKVSCVSQGDSPWYSWTLDGHKLTNSELFSRNNEANIIVLRQSILGHLVCSVSNPVSNFSKGMDLTYCAVTPSCDGRKPGGQCFVPLGEAVDIQLMDNMLAIPMFHWIKKQLVILKWRFNKVVGEKSNIFPVFPSNGTVRINDLRRSDAGEYKLETFDGKEKDIIENSVSNCYGSCVLCSARPSMFI